MIKLFAVKMPSHQRFNVGAYRKAQQNILKEIVEQKAQSSQGIKCKQQQLRRLKDKENTLNAKAQEMLFNMPKTPPSSKTLLKTRSPTSLNNPGSCSLKTVQRSSDETFKIAEKIHGATTTNKRPAMQKKCKTSELGDYILKSPRVTSYVMRKIQEKEKKRFEKSHHNVLRSIGVYYSAGVMGKRKYQAVRLASTMMPSERRRGGRTAIKYMVNCKIPKLLTYNELVRETSSIDIGNLYSVKNFSPENDETDVKGSFCDLREYLPRLAQFYLSKQKRVNVLKWFGETEGSFLVSFGGDGCPFGKNESACSFLISFLNVGKRVASSTDNFLVFGANCEETSIIVKKYIQAVCKQIADIEGKVYEIQGFHVTFKFSELPNDMKMLAMLAGELPNSAKYFSTFGNVNYSDCGDLKGTFGDNDSKWKPWKYEDRKAVAKLVEKFKKENNSRPVSEQTKRIRLTEYIAKQKSRQEFVPMIGDLIDKAHVEPLHLKNNAWQYFFKAVLKTSLGKSIISSSHKCFSDIPNDICFSQVVNALQFEVKAMRLAKKTKQWFNETQGKKGDISYRFTGKESRQFCHNFMRLIKQLSLVSDSQKERQTVLTLVYIGIRLRDCCSLFNRMQIKEQDLVSLKTIALEYCHANKMFLPYSINPTIWTIGHVVPHHARDVYKKYGQGLLTVTMEGREAKHIALHRLSQNSTYQTRWADTCIFRHEFIMLVWLPEHGYDSMYSESKLSYIPSRVINDSNYCYCGLEKRAPSDSKCMFCGDRLMSLIHDSVKAKQYQPGLCI